MADSPERDGFHRGAVTARIMALARGTQAKILVVDDDELELALVCDRLQSCGLEVRQAANGEEALEALRKEWFPVMVTDWQMPVMSGIELTERLREQGSADTYVIMLTVLDTGFDYERAYAAGVDDYLSKKLPEVELLSRIHAGFSTVSLRRQLHEAREKLAQLSSL
jgi:two-component system, cell cycle response regulator